MNRIALLALFLVVVSCGTRHRYNELERSPVQERMTLFYPGSIQDSLDSFLSSSEVTGRPMTSILVSFSIQNGDTVILFREQYPPFVNSPFTDPLSIKRGTFAQEDITFHIVYQDFIKSIPFIREDSIEFQDSVSRLWGSSDDIVCDLSPIQKIYTYRDGALTSSE